MAQVITMPKMGNTVESVIIGEIFISVGDTITIGQKLFTYETDKSTTEYISEITGKILKILFEEGDEVEVLKNIIIVGKNDDDISSFLSETGQKLVVDSPPQSEESKTVVVKPEIMQSDVENLGQVNNFGISWRAKATSKELAVSFSNLSGTGVGARVVEKDVLKFYHTGTSGGKADQISSTTNFKKTTNKPLVEFNKVPYTPMRNAISKAMMGSLQKSAQLTMMAPFDAGAILRLRADIKANYEILGIANSSINDIIVFALSRILPKFPHINAIVGEDYSEQYNVAHIAIAVDTPAGLVVPVIKNASQLTLSEISQSSVNLIKKARDNQLKSTEMQGGTFTISNLGLSGVTVFTPVLNYPQAALLGVGSPKLRLRFDKDKNIEEYSEIILSLTMDHRPIDGAAVAEFLKELVKILESVNVLFL